MIEGYIWIKENYETVYKRYVLITGDTATAYEYDTSEIVCNDITFQEEGEWCLITFLDSFSEEILLELSNGNRLAYFFSDDSQMDCEFLVIEDNQIIRKKYIYADTPKLNEDEGFLLCEEKNKIQYWNDIDYVIEIAREDPDNLFEHVTVQPRG